MTNYILHTFWLLMINTPLIAQENDNKTVNPDTFYPLSKNTFICKHEVSNKAYKQFLNSYNDSESEVLKVQNKLWKNQESGLLYLELYHIAAYWENHPVVNVNQEAAKTYCKWLTTTYNKSENRKYKKVNFRLPTEKEWMKAYNEVKGDISIESEKLTYTEKFSGKENALNEEEKKLVALNDKYEGGSPQLFLEMQEMDVDKVVDDFLARPVTHHRYPTQSEIFNLVGNVSEWLDKPNTAIGGNYNMSNDLSLKELTNSFESDVPSPRIGFRLVMEVIEP